MDLENLSNYDLIEVAWVAGLLEGEGCFLKVGNSPRITCGSVDKLEKYYI